jgi:hypothetical protein
MANSIKKNDETPALQVTKSARAAGLAEEASGDDLTGADRWESLANVRVYGFDSLMLVLNHEKMNRRDVAELVATAASDTGSIHKGLDASVRVAGNGCMVSLPGMYETGFRVGDTAPVHPAPDMLVVHDSGDRQRLATDLVTIRKQQSDQDIDTSVG